MNVIRCFFVVFLLAAPARAAAWTDNYAEAVKQAQAEKKFLLLDFTGSDWCGWCKRLDAEVFSKNQFRSFAETNLVCVKIDFPQGFNLPGKTVRQNAELARRHNITGYPTILLLTPDEKAIARTGYVEGGADVYVKHLHTLLEPHRTALAAVSAGTAAGSDDYRVWTSVQGVSLEARLEQRVGNMVQLRTRENKVVAIQINALSPADQAYLYAPRKP